MPETRLVQSAAAILADRQRQSATGPRLPEACRPLDFDTALAIQERTAGLLGARTGGWKCGTPAQGKLVAARIYADCIWRDSPCPAQEATVRIEPELAFIFGRDLPPRDLPYAPAEIDDAVGAVHLALEVIGSRYRQPEEVPFVEHLADRLLNQGLFIGPGVQAAALDGAGSMSLTLVAGAEETRQETRYEARHPDGDPRLPLYWLANFLRERGCGLKAGEAVITGSYIPSVVVPAGQDVAVEFGALGMLRVRFRG